MRERALLTNGPTRAFECAFEERATSFIPKQTKMVGTVRKAKPTTTKTPASKRWMSGRKPIGPMRQNALNVQELKFKDTAISTLVDTTTEVINQIALITEGDGASNRDGQVVKVKSIRIVGRATQVPAAAATSAPIMYLWVVLDKQPNGAALAVTDFLTTTVAGSALPNTSFEWRFKTLTRLVIPLNSQAGVTTAYNNQAAPIEVFYKFKQPLEIRFSGTAGTVADVATNNLCLVAGAADSDDTITFTGTARLRFTG